MPTETPDPEYESRELKSLMEREEKKFKQEEAVRQALRGFEILIAERNVDMDMPVSVVREKIKNRLEGLRRFSASAKQGSREDHETREFMTLLYNSEGVLNRLKHTTPDPDPRLGEALDILKDNLKQREKDLSEDERIRRELDRLGS